MALKKVGELIELISDIDEAVISTNPLVLKEDATPYIFVFKSPKDLGVRDEYLRKSAELQKCIPMHEFGDKDLIQKKMNESTVDEQINLVNKINEKQLEILELLLVGHKEGKNGKLIEKNKEIIELIDYNDVVGEFYNKLINRNKPLDDKKKS